MLTVYDLELVAVDVVEVFDVVDVVEVEVLFLREFKYAVYSLVLTVTHGEPSGFVQEPDLEVVLPPGLVFPPV